MSKLAKKPIVIPEKVNLESAESKVKVKGPLGELEVPIRHEKFIKIRKENNNLFVDRNEDTKQAKMFQGLYYALIKNAIIGVSQGFKKILEIVGVGYQAQIQSNKIIMKLGFSHPVEFVLPEGITAKIDQKGVEITLSGIDKYLVGEVAAKLRKIKPPEPYKGTGIRYKDEHIIRKLGKAAIARAGGEKK